MSAPDGSFRAGDGGLWCALCPTHCDDRAGLDRHLAESHQGTQLSTSARLREMQGALAASQADLTRALAERDRFVAAADELERGRRG